MKPTTMSAKEIKVAMKAGKHVYLFVNPTYQRRVVDAYNRKGEMFIMTLPTLSRMMSGEWDRFVVQDAQ